MTLNKFLKTNRHFREFVCFLLLIAIAENANCQTFATKNIELHDFYNEYFQQEIAIEVAGLPLKIDENFGIENVEITIHHNRSSDLKIQLQAPDGTTAWVTNRNADLMAKIISTLNSHNMEQMES